MPGLTLRASCTSLDGSCDCGRGLARGAYAKSLLCAELNRYHVHMNSFQRSVSLLPWVIASLLVAQCGGKSTSPRSVVPAALPFVQDDYAAALAQARQLKIPLFIESWAPW